MKRRRFVLVLSDTEIDQLMHYCEWAEAEYYYGPKAAYTKRHARIVAEIAERKTQ